MSLNIAGNHEAGLLSAAAELGKLRITIAVTFTVAVGYIMQKQYIDFDMVFPMIGTLLLSMGSSAFNHVQEWRHDRLMKRTMNRPVPAGRVTPSQAAAIAGILCCLGLLVLTFFTNEYALLFGFSGLVWYNIIYTPLKRVTATAVLPGAVVGAIPPAIGFAAAGGDPADFRIWILGFFIFVWQIPHFMLLVMLYGKEYKEAGYPVLSDMMTAPQMARVTYIWIVSLVVSSLLIPFFLLTDSYYVPALYILGGSYLLVKTGDLLRPGMQEKGIRNAFKFVNLFVLIVLFVLIINNLM